MNKKTIVIICSSIIGLLVVALIAIWLISTFKNKYFSYEEVESRVIKATEKYYKENENMLPATDGSYNLSYSTLVDGEYIKPLNQMLKDGDKCTIKITVIKTGINYSYIPYLNCGDNYFTKELYKQILADNEIVTAESGLYQNQNGNYIFRGKIENNYVSFGTYKEKKETFDILWRIISIDDKTIKLKKVVPLEKDTAWDNRYNIVTEKASGYNDFDTSILKEYLLKFENEKAFLTENEMSKLIKRNLCIGTRSKTDVTFDGSSECSILSKESYYFGTMVPYEYISASIDENCKTLSDRSCSNFNYLSDKSHNSDWILTTDPETNYNAYYFNGSTFALDSAKYKKDIYPVIILNEFSMYASGLGTESDPYRIK